MQKTRSDFYVSARRSFAHKHVRTSDLHPVVEAAAAGPPCAAPDRSVTAFGADLVKTRLGELETRSRCLEGVEWADGAWIH